MRFSFPSCLMEWLIEKKKKLGKLHHIALAAGRCWVILPIDQAHSADHYLLVICWRRYAIVKSADLRGWACRARHKPLSSPDWDSQNWIVRFLAYHLKKSCLVPRVGKSEATMRRVRITQKNKNTHLNRDFGIRILISLLFSIMFGSQKSFPYNPASL